MKRIYRENENINVMMAKAKEVINE
jgi:hypothetical protein